MDSNTIPAAVKAAIEGKNVEMRAPTQEYAQVMAECVRDYIRAFGVETQGPRGDFSFKHPLTGKTVFVRYGVGSERRRGCNTTFSVFRDV